MKKLLICMFLTILSIATVPVYANDAHHQAADNQKSYSSKGEVVAMEMALSKVKLKHDAIPELKWPEMTMFFNVADKSLLDTLKTGDQVEFEFIKVDGGGPLITKITPLIFHEFTAVQLSDFYDKYNACATRHSRVIHASFTRRSRVVHAWGHASLHLKSVYFIYR